MRHAKILAALILTGGLVLGCERNSGQAPAAVPAAPVGPSTPESPAESVTPPVPAPNPSERDSVSAATRPAEPGEGQ